jgi:hypothetical protein
MGRGDGDEGESKKSAKEGIITYVTKSEGINRKETKVGTRRKG